MSTPNLNPRFALQRATDADIPEITKLCWLSFPQHVRDLLLGCPAEADLPRLVDHFARAAREDHHAVWVKTVDRATGKVAAAARWKVFPNAGQPASGDEVPPPWLEGAAMEEARGLLGEMNAERRRANDAGGFVRE